MIVGLILLACIAQVGLKAELEVPESLTVGDRFTLSAELTHPKDLLASTPVLDSLGPFAIVSVDSSRTFEGDTVRRIYAFELAAFGTGELWVPPLRTTYVENEEEHVVRSDSLSLTVASVLPEDMTEVRDIKPVLSFPSRLWIVLLAAFVLALVLAWLVLRFLRRRRVTEEALVPARPPWEVALDALMRLPFDEWRKSGAVKAYYFALSEVLKRYLEGRFGFAAAEETTSEVLQSLRERKVQKRDRVRDFFEGADTVKYSKRAPTEREMEAAYEDVKGIVEDTVPKAEEGTE